MRDDGMIGLGGHFGAPLSRKSYEKIEKDRSFCTENGENQT
jgi:hypothetical protein